MRHTPRIADAPSRTSSGVLQLDQARLNIESKSRTNRLPWKGQFSPELIAYLMKVVCPESKSFIDPFCGSGTVLFEAIDRGCSAVGTEVNPAAWHLSSLASFPCQPKEIQVEALRRLRSLAADFGVANTDLLSKQKRREIVLEELLSEPIPFLRLAFASAVMLGMGDKPELSRSVVAKGAFLVLGLLNNIKGNLGNASTLLRDSRSLPLATGSVDSLITSPPYINVFNYHQNYRPAIELLGWSPLQAAKSEIGANRKHRMNRFLTVIQYAIDMAQAINEGNRVLIEGAPCIIVMGRTSNVLGTAFSNSNLIFDLMKSAPCCGRIISAERVFTNRYGEQIYEDIIITNRVGASLINLDTARLIGRSHLEISRAGVPESNRLALENAIDNAQKVTASPFLQITTPDAFSIFS